MWHHPYACAWDEGCNAPCRVVAGCEHMTRCRKEVLIAVTPVGDGTATRWGWLVNRTACAFSELVFDCVTVAFAGERDMGAVTVIVMCCEVVCDSRKAMGQVGNHGVMAEQVVVVHMTDAEAGAVCLQGRILIRKPKTEGLEPFVFGRQLQVYSFPGRV